MAIVINGSTGISATELSTVLGDNAVETTDITDGAVTAAKLSTGHPNWDSSGNVGIGTSSPAGKLTISGGGSYAPSLSGQMLTLRSGAGVAYMTMGNGDGVDSYRYIGGASATQLFGKVSDTGTVTEHMRIDSSGKVGINTTAPAGNLHIVASSGVSPLILRVATNGDWGINFRNASDTTVGSVAVNASSTAYNTSSDYRLKENVAPMTGALATVTALKPCTYTWKADGSAGQGFIAHELQAVVPDCVTGEKDAVDADGNPVYQGVDTSFLVATLTAAIQELKAELDAAKERIAILENV